MSPSSGSQPRAADLLETILAATRRTIESRMARESLDALERRALTTSRQAGALSAALSRSGRMNVIAECKRRSPSRGVLRVEYDPVAIARGYAAAGAAAISILTEPSFFDGTLDHLTAVRAAVDVPILRKDFVVSEYQLLEARACGADAVLLIVAALDQKALASLHNRASALGLDVLVEVHDENELARAVDAGARIVGVNNRNLRTLKVDIGLSERMAPAIPRDVVAVAESGLKSGDELRRLLGLGYRGFLIGERFMTAPEPDAALQDLLGAACS